MIADPPKDSRAGFVLAISAYLSWGILPLYLKAVSHLSPVEVVGHRILWSVPVAGGVLWALGRGDDIWQALRNPRHLAMSAMAVVALTAVEGRPPMVSLGIVASWGAYAFCKKRLPIGPHQGFLLEVLILSGPALLLYANGAKLLKLSTIGILQYITPTLIFLLADAGNANRLKTRHVAG